MKAKARPSRECPAFCSFLVIAAVVTTGTTTTQAADAESGRAELEATQEELRDELEDTRDDVDFLTEELDGVKRLAAETVPVIVGREVYRQFCRTCHGDKGDGRGPTAEFIAARPRDFTRGQYKWRTTPTGSLPTDADIIRTIQRGVPGTAMPSWGNRLSREQLTSVVAYIKTLSPHFRKGTIDEVIEVPSEVPGATPEAVRRGRALYLLMQCWTCHGFTGEGDGPAAPTLKDDEGRKIEAYDFTRGRLHSGGAARDIFRTISTGVNGTPMPSYVEVLAFGRESFAELPPALNALDAAEKKLVGDFIASLPPVAAVNELDGAARRAYTTQLRWSLVHYIQSLAQARSWFSRFIFDDPYLTD